MTTPGQQLDANTGHIDNLAHDLTELATEFYNFKRDTTERLEALEGAVTVPDPGTPVPKPDPPTTARTYGCNIGFHQDADWSPDKPDDPRYVGLLKPVAKVLRFMDWDKINDKLGSPALGFGPVDAAELARQIDIAVACDSDFYLNLRFYDNAGVVKLKMDFIRDHISPSRKLYVEWGNEPWNGTAFGKELQRLSGEQLGGNKYFDEWAMRASAAFKAAKQADPDCITVLGCLTANPWIAKQVEKRLVVSPDAHGLTTYFGAGLGGTPDPNTTEQQILDSAWDKLYSKEIPRVQDHLEYSQSIGRQTIAYEGGPHFAIDPSLHTSHKTVWQNMNAANRNPAIVEHIEAMDNAWFNAGGGPIIKYTYLSLYDKWGSWGLGESLDTITTNPKYKQAAGVK